MATRTYVLTLNDALVAAFEARLAAENPPRTPELALEQAIFLDESSRQKSDVAASRSQTLTAYQLTWNNETTALLAQIDQDLGGMPT